MVDNINRQQMAANYGFALAFMKSNPELWHLFNQAVQHTWDPNLFIAKLRGTDWFKTHSANVRNAIMQQSADPATYQANVNQMYSTVKDTYGRMFGSHGIGDDQLKSWAETAFRMGWSDAQLVDHISDSVNYRKLLRQGNLGGTAGEVSTQLDQLVDLYGLKLGNQWKARQMEKLLSGGDTIGGVQDRVREWAKREYAAFADQIDGGATVADIAEPYRQQMADLLELNPNQVDIRDKVIQDALKQKDQKGRPAAMSLTDFADKVRQDKRWQYTDNAREQTMSVTQDLLRNFGLIA